MNGRDCPARLGSDQCEAGRGCHRNAINAAICYSWAPGAWKRHRWKSALPRREVLGQFLPTHEGSGQSRRVGVLVRLRLGGTAPRKDTEWERDCCGASPGWKASVSFPTPWWSDARPSDSSGTDHRLGGIWVLLLHLGKSKAQHGRKPFVYFCTHKATTSPPAAHPGSEAHSGEQGGWFPSPCKNWSFSKSMGRVSRDTGETGCGRSCHPSVSILPPFPLPTWGTRAACQQSPCRRSKRLLTSSWCWLPVLRAFCIASAGWGTVRLG